MAEVIKPLFDTYGAVLEQQGIVTKAGTIIDASFVEVPRQRNTREQNDLIKAGQTSSEWKKQPHKLSQKDLDGRWAKKNHETFYGYKNHLRAEAESKLNTDFTVTDAAVHDSQPLPKLIGPQNQGEKLFADSADKSVKTDAQLAQWGMINYVHEKSARSVTGDIRGAGR